MSLGPTPYPILNESTSVVQVNTSGLQSGQAALVYVSSAATPGILVTVRDADGTLSSPQSILLSTVGGTLFSDSTFSTTIRQGYGGLSLYAPQPNLWTVVAAAALADPTASYSTRGLDATEIRATSNLRVRDVLSTLHTQAVGSVALNTYNGTQALYASTLYVGPSTFSAYQSPSPGDPRVSIGGALKVYGGLATTGSLFVRDEIFVGSDFFAGGQNISSRNGVLTFGGNVVTQSTLRAQRGPSSGVLSTAFLEVGPSSAVFVGPATVASSATVLSGGAVAVGRLTSTTTTLVSSATATSSVGFGSGAAAATLRVDTPGAGLTFFGTVAAGLNTAAVSTAAVANSGSLETATLFTTNLLPAPAATSLLFSSATLFNPAGSLQLSSLTTGSAVSQPRPTTTSAAATAFTTASTLAFSASAATPSAGVSFSYPSYGAPGPSATLLLSTSWAISTVGPASALLASNATLQTRLADTGATTASASASIGTATSAFSTLLSTASVAHTLRIEGPATSSFQLLSTPFTAIGGSITGTATTSATASAATSTLQSGTLSAPATLRFPALSTQISTLRTASATVAQLYASSITVAPGPAFFGAPAAYSTFNPSTPWLLTSSSGLDTTPGTTSFSRTLGLGTPYDPVDYSAIQSSVATYTIIDPLALQFQTLSTAYVNTIAGTGTPGSAIGNGGAAITARIGSNIGQPATDSQGNIYFGAQAAGAWQVRRVGAADGRITTVAGRNQFFYGDAGPASAAALGAHLLVATAASGIALVSDASNNRIRLVNAVAAPFTISTIAGTEFPGYAGDAGQATAASLLYPGAATVDSSGSTYIADTGNHAVRRISPTGVITTFAGTPTVPGYTGDGGLATAARLQAPQVVLADASNNILIADTANNVVRKVTAETNLITTIAGTGTAGYTGDGGQATAATLFRPIGLALDVVGNLFIADASNNVVRRIAAATGIITTVAGAGSAGFSGNGGPATAAQLDSPCGVAINSSNLDLYIADTTNNVVRRVSSGTGVIGPFAGTGTPGFSGDGGLPANARLSSPTSVAFDAGANRAYIADDGNFRIRFVNLTTNRISTLAGNGSPFTAGNGGPASNAMFRSIPSVAADSSSNLFVVDSAANQIRRIAATTSTITAYAGTGTAGFAGDGAPAITAQLYQPSRAILDSQRTLYFTDELNQRVRRINNQTGIITTVAGDGTAWYTGDGVGATSTALNYPGALALDATSNLYIADTSNYRVRRVDATTNIITTYLGAGYLDPVIAGASSIGTPLQTTTALAIDAASQLYFTELETNRIWVLSTNSTVQPVSAAPAAPPIQYRGDAGPLSSATFSAPQGLLIDASNNLLIADTGNYRLRRSYTTGYPQLQRYINLQMRYTNYSTATGSASININGSTVKTFSAASGSNDAYSLTDTPLWSYPLLSSNPATGNQLPYITIQQNAAGYTQLQGNLWVSQIPAQQSTTSYLNQDAGIEMRFGRLLFTTALDDVTIENRHNDASTRSLFYTGSLISASDPSLKDVAGPADLTRCQAALAATPLRRFKYIDPYLSTFQVRDRTRLGFLTTEVAATFPKSIHKGPEGTTDTLDLQQLTFAHLGTTQALLNEVTALEAAVAELQGVAQQRQRTTQRKGEH